MFIREIHMRCKVFLMILVFFLLFPINNLSGEKSDFPAKYKKWIEEEVVYIITPKEKEVFFKLETNKERDMFIDLFWRQRDPTPGTPRNEFKEEHFRRIEYANKEFKRYSSIEGWRTDMGRIYIILGEPIQREKFHRTEAFPIELWHYYGNPKFRQTPVFRLLFFRRYGVGPFELYDPIADGPKSLTPLSSMRLPSYKEEGESAPRSGAGRDPGRTRGLPADWLDKVKDPRDLAAYEILRDEVGFEIADTSFSSFPGGYGPDYMLPSAILIREVQTYPQKKVKDDYAYEFLEHKAIVEVDYSVNHIGSSYRIQVLEEKPGLFFVNYLIEPEILSMDFYEDKYFTNVRTSIRVTDSKGKTILQHMRNFPIEMKKKQIKKMSQSPFHLYDSFPLIPGNYKFNLLFENMVTKEFTSIERDIFVPEPGSLQMSSLILTDRVNKESPYTQVNRAFQIGNLQIYPSLKNHFFKENKLSIFFQIYGLTQELKEQGRLEFVFYKDNKNFKTIAKGIKEYESNRDFLEEISLEEILPGQYGLEVSLRDPQGKEILFDRKDFSVLAISTPNSWIVSQSNPPTYDPVYSFLLGNQFINKGEIGKARDLLEKACFMKPDSLDFALSYTRTLLILKEFQLARDILFPFIKAKKENYALYYYLGKASEEVGDFKEAISYYQEALSHKGNIVDVLNSIGDCYFNLDDKEEALKAWKKSLEINPDQDKIKKAVETIKKIN